MFKTVLLFSVGGTVAQDTVTAPPQLLVPSCEIESGYICSGKTEEAQVLNNHPGLYAAAYIALTDDQCMEKCAVAAAGVLAGQDYCCEHLTLPGEDAIRWDACLLYPAGSQKISGVKEQLSSSATMGASAGSCVAGMPNGMPKFAPLVCPAGAMEPRFHWHDQICSGTPEEKIADPQRQSVLQAHERFTRMTNDQCLEKCAAVGNVLLGQDYCCEHVTDKKPWLPSKDGLTNDCLLYAGRQKIRDTGAKSPFYRLSAGSCVAGVV